jgi:hypothetical protein
MAPHIKRQLHRKISVPSILHGQNQVFRCGKSLVGRCTSIAQAPHVASAQKSALDC